MTTILDCSDNNPRPSFATFRKYDAVILKLYGVGSNIGWTADAIRVAKAAGRPWGLYSADTTPTWGATVEALHALGLKPGKVPVYQDWYEFLVRTMTPAEAIARCRQGVAQAHGDNVKLGGYGAELNAWVGYDRAPAIAFDSRWVANGNDVPGIPFDLWQRSKNADGDVSTTALSPATLFAQTLGPWKEPDVTGEADAYFEELAKAGVTHGDFAGNQSYLTGYRIAKHVPPLAFPDRLKGNDAARQGYRDGGGK